MAALDVPQIITELRQAVDDCSCRGLGAASDWASELLNSIPYEQRIHVPFLNAAQRIPPLTSTPLRPPLDVDGTNDTAMDVTGNTPAAYAKGKERAHALDGEHDDPDRIRQAQSLFTRRELMRVGEVLEGCKGNVAWFMKLYARYLTSDKRANDRWEAHQNIKLKWSPAPVNDQLNSILNDIAAITPDPFCLFLKGIILFQLKKRAEAIEALIISLQAYPCNWSCWLQLGHCIDNVEEFTRLQPHFPQHFMAKVFGVKMAIDLFTATLEDAVEQVEVLLATFPGSSFLKAQKAMILFDIKEVDEAEQVFDEIHEKDPCRVDDMDIYSNILFLRRNSTKLGDLARKMIEVNPDRPEVCCLVGNYYSMQGEHEKAVLYFRRALALDKSYIAAWTLVGHEYVELKNSHAAIEAYRRAVDVNRKDYRAWYGLGQTYELLDMHFYALHYYQRAAALRPYEARMWQALASCYMALKRPVDALQCLKRALLGEGADVISIYNRIAQLLESSGERAEGVLYHQKVITACCAQDRPKADYSKNLIAVAQWYIECKVEGRPIDDKDAANSLAAMEVLRESNIEDAGTAAELARRLRDCLDLNTEKGAASKST